MEWFWHTCWFICLTQLRRKKYNIFFYPLWEDVSGMNLINEWGRACTVSCDAIGMLMVSSSVSASQSVDSTVFQMSQCLAKIGIVIQNRWSCLRTKQSWCKLMEEWGWKKWQNLSRWMPCYTHSHLGFTVSRSNKEGSCSIAAGQKLKSNRKDPQYVSSSFFSWELWWFSQNYLCVTVRTSMHLELARNFPIQYTKYLLVNVPVHKESFEISLLSSCLSKLSSLRSFIYESLN